MLAVHRTGKGEVNIPCSMGVICCGHHAVGLTPTRARLFVACTWAACQRPTTSPLTHHHHGHHHHPRNAPQPPEARGQTYGLPGPTFLPAALDTDLLRLLSTPAFLAFALNACSCRVLLDLYQVLCCEGGEAGEQAVFH